MTPKTMALRALGTTHSFSTSYNILGKQPSDDGDTMAEQDSSLKRSRSVVLKRCGLIQQAEWTKRALILDWPM